MAIWSSSFDYRDPEKVYHVYANHREKTPPYTDPQSPQAENMSDLEANFCFTKHATDSLKDSQERFLGDVGGWWRRTEKLTKCHILKKIVKVEIC